ncbi:hypothetical protein CgunFtcFv8_009132 [Champsocephalus gunnari]|uniref:Uncharacterized protein n=1 Tax=Champsocephalus gunnari TaxID=52237 RepID=A0AAN8D3S0_CHAGU|nr:hypothetical protein CgunFtcFv8_009132 [Champsocephalus gunnari]
MCRLEVWEPHQLKLPFVFQDLHGNAEGNSARARVEITSEASEKNSPRSPKVIMSMNNFGKRSLFVKRRHATSANRIEHSTSLASSGTAPTLEALLFFGTNPSLFLGGPLPGAGQISMRALVSSELVSVFHRPETDAKTTKRCQNVDSSV